MDRNAPSDPIASIQSRTIVTRRITAVTVIGRVSVVGSVRIAVRDWIPVGGWIPIAVRIAWIRITIAWVRIAIAWVPISIGGTSERRPNEQARADCAGTP